MTVLMKILIADDHQLFREGLRHILTLYAEASHIVEASNFAEAIEAAERESGIDLALLDLTMSGGPWSECLVKLRHLLPSPAHIVIVSDVAGQSAVKLAIDLGASGFVTKVSSGQVFLAALNLVVAGGIYLPAEFAAPANHLIIAAVEVPNITLLTPRQREILSHLKTGKSNREIATDLGLAEGTVKLHVTSILKALSVRSRTQAALLA